MLYIDSNYVLLFPLNDDIKYFKYSMHKVHIIIILACSKECVHSRETERILEHLPSSRERFVTPNTIMLSRL